MRNSDSFDPSGHLEIWKVYPDGTEEIAFDEANTITSGMGVGLGMLYAGSGATDITNFQVRNFQLGVSGSTVISNYGVSQSSLVSALGQVNAVSDYKDAISPLVVAYQELMTPAGGAKSTSTGASLWLYGVIPDNGIKRVDLNSVTYIIYLDQNTCNSHTLNEVGLFMQNPAGLDPKRSVLVAYRPFTDIVKTDDFSLVFKWTLNF